MRHRFAIVLALVIALGIICGVLAWPLFVGGVRVTQSNVGTMSGSDAGGD